MAMKRCPVCGERYSDTYKNCPFCEEEEYWEEEQQETVRRPILREGVRSSSRGSKSPYSIVTPILIVLIVLMAALLVYLLYGDKLFSKAPPDDSQTDIQSPVGDAAPDPGGAAPEGPDEGAEPGGEDPEGTPGSETDPPDGGDMPEDGGEEAGGDSPGDGSSGGMSYAAAAALPRGLTLSSTDFTEPVSTGTVKLRVSGGTGSYTWISENPSVASVASDGTVTLVSAGTTNVVVTDGSKRAICIVRVTGGSGGSGGGTTAPSTAPSSSGGSLKTGSAVVVNGGNGVRVRSGPGTSYEILATVPNGGSVQVKSDAGGGWYEITFVNVGGVTTTGYMKGEFLSNG